ncbi:MAG: alanine--tRNA ligase, partial [Proteobacteria bacterium]|nr:alanine--tRNA ligase [Pseudomonadota bacterium]
MKTAQIRHSFLQFFADKGHTIVESAPLVPANDPSLLFTNSGMVQFKDLFLGIEKRPYRTAVTAQRCLRAGGKHNDLENVGYTARHHTFFEMLGNFSFGEYFKEKAIPYAWEFLTDARYLGIAKEHLWVTVFGGGDLFNNGQAVPADEEAADLWRQTLMAAGFSAAEAEKRIIRISSTDNFWMMGDSGPCGPCSEIFYDQDINATRFRGEEEAYADTCVEIWNLVFMQYQREAGVMNALPQPCVDTGMGLERISAVMQGVQSNYDVDLFRDLLAAVAALGTSPTLTPSHRVIADHIRAAAFLIADGVLPSNDGRGYVLRRIIRRALRHLYKICPQQQTLFHTLVAPLVHIMGAAFPLLSTHQKKISATLKQEEENFSDMLKNGMTLLEESIVALPVGSKTLAGETVFKLYDTYGFPPDMTATIIRDDYQLAVDEAGFENCMQQQRSRSRAASSFIEAAINFGQELETEFLGYDAYYGETKVTFIFRKSDGIETEVANVGDEVFVTLESTPFYGKSGGRIGDSGTITAINGGAVLVVNDTQKTKKTKKTKSKTTSTASLVHIARVEKGRLKKGDVVQCVVDRDHRKQIIRADLIEEAKKFGDALATEFIGYENYCGESEVSFLFGHDDGNDDGGKKITTANVGDEVLVVLKSTPFYGESGGQIGDSGTIKSKTAVLTVSDTTKILPNAWGHFARVEEGSIQVGDAVQCAVDQTRRLQITRAHSAAHLMHAALRQVLGTHVEQRGSYVSADSVRFDFSHNGAVTAEELRQVERIVNAQIVANAAVQTEVMAFDDALKTGAMALFGEKYGDKVRVVTIDKTFSVELCGGTHVTRAGDIGLFQFTGETAIAAGIRRVEALTTTAAIHRTQAQIARISEMALLLKTPSDRLEEKILQLREQLRSAQKQVEQLQHAQQAQQTATLAQLAEVTNGVRILVQQVDNADAKLLRQLAVQLQTQLAPAAIFLAGGNEQAVF